MNLSHLLLIMFAPERFIAGATQHAISREFQTNTQLKAAYPDQRLPDDRREEFESAVREQTSSIRAAFLVGFAITLLSIVIGGGLGVLLRHLFGAPSKLAVYALQAIGAAIILGATLAEAGRKIQTWNGETLAEEINAVVFRGLYVVGTFLFVVSVAWDAI